jgi:hypothetical protein
VLYKTFSVLGTFDSRVYSVRSRKRLARTAAPHQPCQCLARDLGEAFPANWQAGAGARLLNGARAPPPLSPARRLRSSLAARAPGLGGGRWQCAPTLPCRVCCRSRSPEGPVPPAGRGRTSGQYPSRRHELDFDTGKLSGRCGPARLGLPRQPAVPRWSKKAAQT